MTNKNQRDGARVAYGPGASPGLPTIIQGPGDPARYRKDWIVERIEAGALVFVTSHDSLHWARGYARARQEQTNIVHSVRRRSPRE